MYRITFHISSALSLLACAHPLYERKLHPRYQSLVRFEQCSLAYITVSDEPPSPEPAIIKAAINTTLYTSQNVC